jgi:hypothetical protein
MTAASRLARVVAALVSALLWLVLPAAAPRAAADPRPVLRAERVAQPPSIDGLLDDDAWQVAPLPLGEWRSYNPLHGEAIPQQTRVWLAYDSRALYIAFECHDPEPSRIKTSITRRDQIFSDDWVGISLDALGTGQLAYHMLVNPSGIQLDMLNGASGNEDLAPDWVWESAGRRTPTGYTVEMRLPLESIRFAGGDDVRMGVLFWRRVSRTGLSVSWPALEPGKWVFQKHASLHFDTLRARLPREVIPAATYAWSEGRRSSPAWDRLANEPQIGFSARVGLTPTVTLDATVNPDFSQVESDAFQVDVNQRFPVFYSEKRPFFMAASDVFSLGGVGNGDASMIAAVHTRRIVDPIVGAKLTGSHGRVTYGWLNAADEAPGREIAEGARGHDDTRLLNVGRLQYNLGPGSFAGAIVTDTRFAGERNQVVGGDLSWQPREGHRLSGFALQSWSDRQGVATKGSAVLGNYFVSTRRFTTGGQLEHYDAGFAMDTAFYNRVDFTNGWGYGEVSFYPDKDRHPWVRRVSPFTFMQVGRDRAAGGDEYVNATGVRLRLARQGFVRADRITAQEAWAGREFQVNRWRAFGGLQLYRWMTVNGRWHAGGAVFYDPDDPYTGRSQSAGGEVTFQPTGQFTQALAYTRVTFDNAGTGARVYTVDLVNARTTYQFTRRVFVRGILQHDSSRRRLLTDLLASYELRPGTVFYAGYGGLFQQRRFEDGEWLHRTGDYLAVQRGVFFKASYLHRF